MQNPDRYAYYHEVPLAEIECASRAEIDKFWWAINHWAYSRGADLIQYHDEQHMNQCWEVVWDAENWTGEVHEYWMCKLASVVHEYWRRLLRAAAHVLARQ
jgi:hypothetical protein